MKNIANILICTFVFGTTLSFAGVAEDKASVSTANTLPATAPVLETPAPQKEKISTEVKYSADQKANLIGLKLKSVK
jgi:hypothetical protein